MRPVLLRVLTVGLVVVALARPVSAASRRAEIKDQAKLFSPTAIAQAQQRLQEISAKHDLDIVIETVKSLSPEEQKKLSRSGTNLRKNALVLESLARQRAERLGLDGVLVVFFKVPRDIRALFEGSHIHVTVVVWPEERHATLSARDCEFVRKRFAGPPRHGWHLRRPAESADESLRAGVEKIEESLRRTANRGLVDYFTIPLLVLSFLGAWVLLVAVRARVRAGSTEPDAAAVQRPAMLGALFGTVPAFWVYDKLFRPGVPPLSPTEAHEPLLAQAPEPPPEPPLREGEEPQAHAYDANQPGAPVS
jgi:hypothetical protein